MIKAKEYYAKLKECKTEQEFVTAYEDMLNSLNNEVNELISLRRVKTLKSRFDCFREIDQKFGALCALHERSIDNLPDDCYLKQVESIDPKTFSRFFDQSVK